MATLKSLAWPAVFDVGLLVSGQSEFQNLLVTRWECASENGINKHPGVSCFPFVDAAGACANRLFAC
jgi:hypothetical protein